MCGVGLLCYSTNKSLLKLGGDYVGKIIIDPRLKSRDEPRLNNGSIDIDQNMGCSLKKYFTIPLFECTRQEKFDVNLIIKQVNTLLRKNGYYGIQSVKYQRLISKQIKTCDGTKKDSALILVGDLITCDQNPILYRVEASKIRKKITINCIEA